MSRKSIKTFADQVRRRDAYWVERTKIEFAEGLGRLMERRDITRSQLAERIGSSAAYITKILRGDTNFTIESMVKLVRALGGHVSIQVKTREEKAQPSIHGNIGDSILISHHEEVVHPKLSKPVKQN